MPSQHHDKAHEEEHVQSTHAVDQSTESKTDKMLSGINSRLGQQFNLLALLIVVLFLFQGYTYYKLKTLESKGVAGGPTAQAESPLSDEKLLTYAEEISLDEDKFKSCLDSGKMKDRVQKDMAQGAELKVQGTPGFFVNGKFFAGAFPFESFKEVIDKELSGASSSNCTDYSTAMQEYCKDPANLAFNPESQNIDIAGAPARGPKNAKVTIVEFSDFECPFCHRAFKTIEQVLSTYPNDVKLVYKQMPLVAIHPHAQKAAEASLCAQEQGKFWEYHDKMFNAQVQ